MGRRGKDVNPTDVIFVVVAFAVIAYFLFKWVLELIIFLICGIVYFLIWIIKKIKEQKEKNESVKTIKNEKIENTSIDNSSHSTTENKDKSIRKEEKEDNLKRTSSNELITYKTKYDYLFSPVIRSRGIEYYLSDKIVNYKKLKTKCTCTSKGTEDYKTEIFIDSNAEFKDGHCTCPYYQNENLLCKHIYCLLLKYLLEETTPSIEDTKSIRKRMYEEITSAIADLKSLIDEADLLYISNDFEDIDVDVIYSELDTYKQNLFEYENFRLTDLTNENLELINNDIEKVQDIIYLLEENIELTQETFESENEAESSFEEALNTGIVLNSLNDKKKIQQAEKEFKKHHENLKEIWGLSDYEAELVEQGRYNPWEFGNDKEELEEGDYHYEDDL